MSIENGCPNPECNDPDCPGSQIGHNLHAFHLSDLLRRINKGKPMKKKDLGLLADEEVRAFNEMRDTFLEAKKTFEKAEELKKRFWAMTRLAHNLFGKEYDNLSVDAKTGMLSTEIEEDTKE